MIYTDTVDLKQLAAGCKSVAIAGHVRPDGDAVGSCLGLRAYLLQLFPGLQADVFLEEPQERFSLLSGFDDIRTVTEETVYDLFFSLDCADEERLGKARGIFKKARRTVCIDHHISNRGFADLNVIFPDASSTCEVLTALMQEDQLTAEAASALYLGIVHDTGVFRHSCTHPETMEMAAKLMRKGIDANRIINDTYYDKTFLQNKVLGMALAKSELLEGGHVITSFVSMEEMKAFHVTSGDLDGIVQMLMGTVGVEVAVFLYELSAGEWKVSLRSRERVDVSRICQNFGGGGHVRAAGCNLSGSVTDVLTQVCTAVSQAL